MAKFTLTIDGALHELAPIAAALSILETAPAKADITKLTSDTAIERVLDAPVPAEDPADETQIVSQLLPGGGTTQVEVPKKTRARKSATPDASPLGEQNFADQIKEVVAEEAANPTPPAADAAQATATDTNGSTTSDAASSPASDTSGQNAAMTASLSDAAVADLTKQCQALVGPVIGKDASKGVGAILEAIKAATGLDLKSITEVAKQKPEALPALLADLQARKDA